MGVTSWCCMVLCLGGLQLADVLIKRLSCPVFTFPIISVCSSFPLLLLYVCFLGGKSNGLYYSLPLSNS